MGNYSLPPDIADQFSALTARVAALERGPLTARAAIRRTNPLSVPTGTTAMIPYDFYDFNTGQMWNASQPTRLTAPSGIPGGVFLVTSMFMSSVIVDLGLVKSGGGAVVLSRAAAAGSTVQAVWPLLLGGGSYMETQVTNNSGSTASISVAVMSMSFLG